jgi:PKD repeat protein
METASREIRTGRARAVALGLVWAAFACLGCEPNVAATSDPLGAEPPVASFDQDATQGAPGLTVRFTSTARGVVTSHHWDFGPLGTRSERDPVVVFPDEGVYSVGLTVVGPTGSSRVEKTDLISVGPAVVGAFTCEPTAGYAPLTIACEDESENADAWSWRFGDGGTADAAATTHTYTTPGLYTLTRTASGLGGTLVQSTTITVGALSIEATPSSGAGAPADVTFTVDTGNVFASLWIWSIDGEIVGRTEVFEHTFRRPGRYTVGVGVADLRPPASGGTLAIGEREITFDVGYGAPVADFGVLVSGGEGPLDVPFVDLSTGAVDRWEWDFGDGNGCVFPAQPDDPAFAGVPVCASASPSHVYTAVGSYPVQLTVTGPAADPTDPPISSPVTLPDAVRVYVADPGFEQQTPGAPIGGAWQALRPAGAGSPDVHVAIGGAADHGMPTQGARWAVLDGIETDGTSPLAQLDNGIRQAFLLPPDRTVLELDYALLFNEPPASGRLDGVTATVSDGTTTVEVPGARADTTDAYAGTSARFPTRDGSPVRVTPVRTASLDVAQAFPGAGPLTLFTLTVRVGNAGDGLRSPRAYVDGIRFVQAAGQPVTAQFLGPAGLVFAGMPATFTDESCLGAIAAGCPPVTSWRWDFGTRTLTTPPASTGAAEQDPSYTFPRAGRYTVELTARRAESEDVAILDVDVLEPLIADFAVLGAPAGGAPFTAPADVTFEDRSTADPADPVVAWAWDFGGWGTSTLQDPAPVHFAQAGSYPVRLTVTTASGQSASLEQTITLEE